MADTRTCDQCGASFTPRREHARFCRPRCRVAWNKENTGDPQAEASALDWSITAMGDAIDCLAQGPVQDHGQGFAMISEAVWWVTIVDATLVRYHRHAYKGAMQSQAPTRRQAIEGTFAGLRFVRNQTGYHLGPQISSGRRKASPALITVSRPGHGTRCPSRTSDRCRRAGRRGK